jgi:hypothetical protein
MTNYLDDMKYAIQLRDSGTVIDYCDTVEQANYWLKAGNVYLVETKKASCIKIEYTELSGPWGYGHQEESFATYGALLPCVRNLIKWIQREVRIWGPDVRDIKDYFRHCSLYVNGIDKSQWLWKQIEGLNIKTIYV